MSYNLYWGDLHSHCAVSYGHGSVATALTRARQQLDFCSITAHAFWPDMPTDRGVYADIIDYHNEGFARAARNWDRLLADQSAASDETFIALPSYEWHSRASGDHNVYARGERLALKDAPDIAVLRELCLASGALMIPHHIGYAAGYRGINWDHYAEDCSPFVEVFSLHGCSLSEDAPYPMLHDMGPRDWGSTAFCGWERGHKFGIVGGTDHHAAHPGSCGDGRMGVFAENLTRESLWEAFRARRVYAATGDKIDARLHVNDAWIGEAIQAGGSRKIRIAVTGTDALSTVELVKNGRVIGRFFPADEPLSDGRAPYRLRLTWGWGKKQDEVRWDGRLSLSDGAIQSAEPCFSGEATVAPKPDEVHDEFEVLSADRTLMHEITELAERSVAWRSLTAGNLTMRHGLTQSISLAIEAAPETEVLVEVNGNRIAYRLADLIGRGRSHYMRGWRSEAFRIGPAAPRSACTVTAELSDEPERDCDWYHLRAGQTNDQWVWLTPVWVER